MRTRLYASDIQRLASEDTTSSNHLRTRPFSDDTETAESEQTGRLGNALGQTPIQAKEEETQQKPQYTSWEHELIETAQAFALDETLHSQFPDLEIPDFARREDNDMLNEDLIARINRFYKFLLHKQLIQRVVPPTSIMGVRANTVAHQLSTRWMLSPKSGILDSFNNKLEFVRQLIDIGGKDPATGLYWANGQQINQLKVLLKQVETSGTGGKRTDAGESDPRKDLEKIVDDIRKLQGNQDTEASEGYSKGDAKRKPNIRDTGVSLHCGGEAIDVFFEFVVDPSHPVIDEMADIFGLQRSVKDESEGAELWQFERTGIELGDRIPGEEPHLKDLNR